MESKATGIVQINLSAAKLFDGAGRDNAPPGSDGY